MYRTWIILSHTLRETLVQPIFGVLLALGATVLGLYSILPFFTLGEDVLMFKAVGLDVTLVIALLMGLFAASRSIYEEIEDRTMLTLMSKPVSRWQVLVGKYLGLLGASAIAVAVLGAVLGACIWMRIPADYNLAPDPIDDIAASRLEGLRKMHLAGLWPQLVLLWMQVGTLIAISVAISTRFSLVVNVPATILIYLGGNLTRFVDVAAEGKGWLTQAGAQIINTVLPFLAIFDLTRYTIFSPVRIEGTESAEDPLAVLMSNLWVYVAVAALYFVAYVTFTLTLGHLSLRRRELGGNEG
jgi:ABC-type Na+ efflux pump permease subunit